jgi:Secretion system C-terminal sorting domain
MKILLAFSLLFCSFLSAQPTIEWQKTYGGSSIDEPTSVHKTSDGGYIVTGRTASTNGDVFGQHGGFDIWVLKLTTNGNIQWSRVLGGTGTDIGYSIFQTNDGGYLVCGYSSSNDFDISGNHGGSYDGWVIKLTNNGAVEWQKALGGSGWDDIWAAKQTNDNGYILAGRSDVADGDVSKNQGQFDCWVVKLNANGSIEWEKSFGGSLDDAAKSVIQTADGGFLVACQTASNNGDVTGNHGNVDYWLTKLSPSGLLEWQKTYGGNNADIPSDVIQVADGGYIVSGFSGSNSGDVTGNHGIFDFWVIKVSNNGELEWQKALGGSQPDRARGIVASSDGGYVIIGDTESNDGDLVGNSRGAEFWLVKLNSSGQLIWKQTYGGSLAEGGFAIDNTTDNGFILAGYAWSNNGDLTGSENKGFNDFWIVKLSPESISPTQEPHPIHPLSIYPNPASQSISLLTHIETGAMTVRISDLLGREMLRKEMPNDGKLDISALPKGLYIVHAVAGDGSVFRGNLMIGS